MRAAAELGTSGLDGAAWCWSELIEALIASPPLDRLVAAAVRMTAVFNQIEARLGGLAMRGRRTSYRKPARSKRRGAIEIKLTARVVTCRWHDSRWSCCLPVL
jgi:hypothetical protein